MGVTLSSAAEPRHVLLFMPHCDRPLCEANAIFVPFLCHRMPSGASCQAVLGAGTGNIAPDPEDSSGQCAMAAMHMEVLNLRKVVAVHSTSFYIILHHSTSFYIIISVST